MTTASTIKETLGVVNAAAELLKHDYVKKGARAVKAATDLNKHVSKVGGAITQFSSQTSIISRVFIDETLLDEIVLPNLMKSIHEWYAAQIIAALQLSQMVNDHQTVQNVMAVLQTGQNARQTSAYQNVASAAALSYAKLNDRYAAQESFLANHLGEAACEAFGPPNATEYAKVAAKTNDRLRADHDKEINRLRSTHAAELVRAEEENRRLKEPFKNTSVRSISTSENRIGPMGELYEISMTNPNNPALSLKIPVFVQMQPSIMGAEVAPRFIDMNVPKTFWQRWTEMKAGELHFWHDFIKQRDVINRLKSLNKDPQAAAAFVDFQKTIEKKNKYALGDLTDRSGTSAMSANLANSVVIFSEDAVTQAAADSGIDLHRDADRQRYFRNAYAMIIVIVDPMHQRLTIYFNGIDGAIEASYNDFKPKDSKFDPKDFMAALTAFSTNSIGRLR